MMEVESKESKDMLQTLMASHPHDDHKYLLARIFTQDRFEFTRRPRVLPAFTTQQQARTSGASAATTTLLITEEKNRC